MGYSKYRAKKETVDGHIFDSKKEAGRYKALKIEEKAGMIKALELQPKFVLQEKFRYHGKMSREIDYIADFKYWNVHDEAYVVEDVKGLKTDVYKLKKKLFLRQYGDKYIFREV